MLAHQDVALERITDRRLRRCLLHLARHGQCFVRPLGAHRCVHLHHACRHEIGLQVDRALDVAGGSAVILEQALHFGQANLGSGRFRQHIGQFAVGIERARQVFAGDLGLAQHFEHAGIGRVRGLELAGQRQRFRRLVGAQVVRAKLQCRGCGLRIGRAGFFEPGGRFGGVLLQQRQLTQCRHRVGIVLVLLEEGRETRLGGVRLLLLHVQARQVGHGRQEGRLQLDCALERGARVGILALDHEHGALELLYLCAVWLLLLERRDSRFGAVIAFHAHLGLHQRHRGLDRFWIERGGRFEFAQATGLVALRQARQAKRGAHGGRLRRQRGRLLEVVAGLVEVTHLHVRLACQRQQLRILRRVLQRRCQGGDGFGRLRVAQLGLGQQLACIDIVRIASQILAQMLLGLLCTAQVQLGRTGQQNAGHVVRRHLQDFLQCIFRC